MAWQWQRWQSDVDNVHISQTSQQLDSLLLGIEYPLTVSSYPSLICQRLSHIAYAELIMQWNSVFRRSQRRASSYHQ